MLQFSEFELDADAFELRRDGVRVELEPQVLEVILYLARNSGRLVRKEEMLDEIWGDRFVSESALTSRIRSARIALGDDGTTQAMIRTVHGRGYQFVPPVTDTNLPDAARVSAMVPTDTDLAAARVAIDEARWNDARRAFAAFGVESLDPADLERWAAASWWTNDLVECIGVRLEAFRRYSDAGDDLSAARVAIELADDYLHRGSATVSGTWMQRAEALLVDRPDSREAGQLLRSRISQQLDDAVDPAGALALNDELSELAERLGDADLMVQALQDRGRCLVALGRVDEGMRLIDEAMLNAATNNVSANVTGRLYCNMLSTCVGLGHYGRAQDWSDEAITWCTGHADSPFPGLCQVHHAGLRRRMGDLALTIDDLESLASASSFSNVVGGALLELGETHLRRGEIDEAEAAFLQAHAHGADATSGLAQVAIERGHPSDAVDLVRSALAARAGDHISRARLLPILVDAAALADDVELAARAAEELVDVAVACAGAYCGSAAQARATVAWASGDLAAAGPALREAMGFYREVPLPVEMANVRLGLAVVLLGGGSPAIARIERATALAGFESAGAVPIGVGRRWLDEGAELD